MIYDLAGSKKDAGAGLAHANKHDYYALRVVEADGSWQSRNSTNNDALDVYEAFDKVLLRHPLVVESMNALKAGRGNCCPWQRLRRLAPPKRFMD